MTNNKIINITNKRSQRVKYAYDMYENSLHISYVVTEWFVTLQQRAFVTEMTTKLDKF